jgi:uncharacterized membrane protein YsdA (DUF1294 family)
MNNLSWGILIFFALINLTAFLIMLWDKMQSRKKNAERISEGMLFFMATAFGSLGVYAGMFAFHHKTRKWYFSVGIPLLMLQNSVFAYTIYDYLTKR